MNAGAEGCDLAAVSNTVRCVLALTIRGDRGEEEEGEGGRGSSRKGRGEVIAIKHIQRLETFIFIYT